MQMFGNVITTETAYQDIIDTRHDKHRIVWLSSKDSLLVLEEEEKKKEIA